MLILMMRAVVMVMEKYNDNELYIALLFHHASMLMLIVGQLQSDVVICGVVVVQMVETIVKCVVVDR